MCWKATVLIYWAQYPLTQATCWLYTLFALFLSGATHQCHIDMGILSWAGETCLSEARTGVPGHFDVSSKLLWQLHWAKVVLIIICCFLPHKLDLANLVWGYQMLASTPDWSSTTSLVHQFYVYLSNICYQMLKLKRGLISATTTISMLQLGWYICTCGSDFRSKHTDILTNIFQSVCSRKLLQLIKN